MTLAPSKSESDTNGGTERETWAAARGGEDASLLRRDSASYLRQAVSTPCLTSIESAEGAYIFDTDGTPYLDFHGNSAHQIGYAHPRLTRELSAQLGSLPFVPRRFTSPVSVEFAEKLSQVQSLHRSSLAIGGVNVAVNERADRFAIAVCGPGRRRHRRGGRP